MVAGSMGMTFKLSTPTVLIAAVETQGWSRVDSNAMQYWLVRPAQNHRKKDTELHPAPAPVPPNTINNATQRDTTLNARNTSRQSITI